MPLNATDRLDGLPVELSLTATDDDGVWNVLAYEVTMKGRGGVKLTREHFEQCVKNFGRFGQVPIVLYHADTNPTANPEAAMARGWITALRVGSMQRKGQTVATLLGRTRMDDETRALINGDPPRLAFGSITIFYKAIDEESGEDVGAYLYSYSLTNRPALVDLPRLAASAEAPSTPAQPAEVPMSEPVEAAAAPVAVEAPADAFLALASELHLQPADEAEARATIHALAADALDHLAALGFTAATPKVDVLAKLTQLVNDAAKLSAAEAELEALRDEKASREREAAEADVAVLVSCGAIANDAAARAASVSLRVQSPDAFAAMFGAKLAAARKGKPGASPARHDLLTSRVAPKGGAPSALAFALSHSEQCDAMAKTLQAADPSLSYADALAEASRRIKSASL